MKTVKQVNPARRIPREILTRIDAEAKRLNTDASRLLAWLLRRAVEEQLPLKHGVFIP